MTQRMSLLLSAVVSAVLFTIGYLVGALVPGGGDVTDEDFVDFYNSDSEITTALVLAYVLVAGCLALIWFFTELRTRLPDDVISRVAYASAVFGAASVAIGGVLLLAPGSAQLFSDREFLGVDIAHAFAMAGFGIMLIPGMGAFALATALVSLSFLRSGMAPAWLGDRRPRRGGQSCSGQSSGCRHSSSRSGCSSSASSASAKTRTLPCSTVCPNRRGTLPRARLRPPPMRQRHRTSSPSS